MILKELIHKIVSEYGREKIVDRICEIYPEEKKNYDGHGRVLRKLEMMEPTNISEECYKGMEIVITHVVEDWKDPGLTNEEYDSVCGRNGKTLAESNLNLECFKNCHDEESWALDFTPWSEWLGMPIREQTFKDYSELDVMAHCLWEISWMGFDEEIIQEKKEDLDRRVESIKDGTAELIPWEDVKKNLEEEYGIKLDKEEKK